MFREEVEKEAYRPMKGVFMGYFTLPMAMEDGEESFATVDLAPGKRGIMTRRHDPEKLLGYIGCATDDPRFADAHRSGAVAAQKKEWAERFEGAGWRSAEIMSGLLREETAVYSEEPALVQLPTWSRGRVALLGDAAWCPTGATGMGTTSAVVGAYVLAGEIERHGRSGGCVTQKEIADALVTYENRFQLFMEAVQKGVSVSDGLGGWGPLTSSAFAIGVIHQLVGIASFLKLDLEKWLLREDAVKDWELPEYRELMEEVSK